ncbi:MAG: hypothetical protein L0H10_20070, partial [Comamonas sp.]|nr:hypothetical protein [Comamonas sp.]
VFFTNEAAIVLPLLIQFANSWWKIHSRNAFLNRARIGTSATQAFPSGGKPLSNHPLRFNPRNKKGLSFDRPFSF